MARTDGHGNPKWTRDETILALDLYLRLDGQIPSASDRQLADLSGLLRSLPYHREATKKASFRNPASVSFKLQNLRQVATGRGFGNVSTQDRAIWAEFADNPAEVSIIAASIKEAVGAVEAMEPQIDEEFREGRLLTSLHYRRERDPRLRAKVFSSRMVGGLSCDACGQSGKHLPSELQDSIFEVHHLLPLAMTGETKTRVDQTAILCACCHRLVHRLISTTRRWVSIPELRSFVGSSA